MVTSYEGKLNVTTSTDHIKEAFLPVLQPQNLLRQRTLVPFP
jgi:hypothetical protein